MRVFLFLALIFALGCQNESSRDIQDAIDEAHFLLNSRNCDDALDVLQSLYTDTNADYLQVYAAAFACRADFSTTRFFGDELTSLNLTNAGFFSSLASMDSSTVMTDPVDSDYTNLQTAIDTLLYAGGLSIPSTANRANVFGSTITTNLNLQALYMIIVQMGRWFNFYGSADSNGVKGGMTGGNTCLLDYTNPIAALSINNPAGSTGNCTTLNDGHSDLIANRPRQCQSIVLFNNFLDVVDSVTSLGNITNDLDSLTSFSATLNTVCTGAGLGNICSVTSQNECETDPTITNDILQQYYALVFERLFI